MKNIFEKVQLFFALAFLFTVIIGVVWSLYPYKTVTFKNLPFPIQNEDKTIARGDRARYVVDYCKESDINPTVVKYFVDGVIYETAPTLGVMKNGCFTETLDVYIPKALPPGVYSVKIVAQFKVNPIRTITVTSNTQQFEVVK